MSLAEILQHPQIQARLDPEELQARRGLREADYIAGLLEEVLEEYPYDQQLQKDYQWLQREYPRLFRTTPSRVEPKNDRKQKKLSFYK